MKPRQNYVAVLCLLLLSSQAIDAGIFKGGRRNDLAMLLAGGILTILFQEGAGLVRKNFEHPYEHHGMHMPMPMPGHAPYAPHPMHGFPYPIPNPMFMGMMEDYGHPMPMPGMGQMKYPMPDIGRMKFRRHPGLGDHFPYAGFMMAHHPPMGHRYPFAMMHQGLGLPMGNSVGVERLEGLKGLRGWKSNGNQDSNYRPSAEDEEAFRQIFMKLEKQGESEPHSGNRGGEYEDSTLGVQYDQAIHKD